MDDVVLVVVIGFVMSIIIMFFVIKVAVESAIRDALREDLLNRTDSSMGDNTPKYSYYGNGSATMLLTSPTRVVNEDGFDHFFVTIGNIKVPCALNERMKLSLEPGSYSLEFKQIARDGMPSYVTSKFITVSNDSKVYIMTNPNGYVIYQHDA